MSLPTIAMRVCVCLRCGWQWVSRKLDGGRPVRCPNPRCKSPYWDRPVERETVSVAVKAARKREAEMKQNEFRKFLNDATKRLQPLRRSKPGVSLYFEDAAAQKAHNEIGNAKRGLRNNQAWEGAPANQLHASVAAIPGGSWQAWAQRIDALLREAGV